jgi:hypothetical protein
MARFLALVSGSLLAVAGGTFRFLRRRPPGHWGAAMIKRRTHGELELTWFDALAPAYASQHTVEEVAGWFRDCGFSDVFAFDDPNVAVVGRAPSCSPEKVRSQGAAGLTA